MKRTPLYKYILVAIAMSGITVAAILFSCDFYRIIPLYVSLMVMLLQTNANRNCFLLGGLNAAYYSIVYFLLGLYGMALYNLLIACPIQIWTFIRWRKRAYAQAAVLRRLSNHQRAGWLLGFSAAWIVLYFILDAFGSGYLILDNTISIISTAGNFASLLYLIEFPFIQILSHSLNIILNLQMIGTDPKQWTYLVYFIYALVCAILSAITLHKLYREQQQS